MQARKAILIAGLGFGDEGKGSVVDYLTRQHNAHTVVRYNGGAQAGHNVVTQDGHQHIFSQFGSGTFIPSVRTHLSQFIVVDPSSIIYEEQHLRTLKIDDAFDRITIDSGAIIVTPFHKLINQLTEISRGKKRYGSCGMGIGQAVEYFKRYGDKVLLAGDLKDIDTVAAKLKFIKEKTEKMLADIMPSLPDTEEVLEKISWIQNNDLIERYIEISCKIFAYRTNITDPNYTKEILDKDGTVIFEGAQGILLDPKFGFHPHVTKTDTTFANALKLLEETGYNGQIKRVGVLRAYATRHGPGPLPTEDENLTRSLPDSHNQENRWQGKFRVGYFDAVAIRYAMRTIGHLDDIALTNLDRLIGVKPLKVCTSYSKNQKAVYKTLEKLRHRRDYQRYVEFLTSLGIPISIVSLGPTAGDKFEVNKISESFKSISFIDSPTTM